MSLKNEVSKYAKDNDLFSCKTLLVAVSGGADSMCLLDICNSLYQESARNQKTDGIADQDSFPLVCAVHINHMIREGEANQDEELVRSYCEEKKIRLFVRTIDVPLLAKKTKRGIEETGRDVRQSNFQDICEQLEASGEGPVYTAVAHHREDVAETFMMNVFRGTGPDGLSGMTAKSGRIIRPLLFASKKDIRLYLLENNIIANEDSTNADSSYKRNFFRNEIFPRIESAYQKDPVQPVLAVTELLRRDKLYFDTIIEKWFEMNQIKMQRAIGLPCDLLRKEPDAISYRLIRRLFTITFGESKNFSTAHHRAVMRMVHSPTGGSSVSLPDRRLAFVIDNVLFFSKNRRTPNHPLFGQDLLSDGMKTLTSPSEEEIRICFDKNGDVVRTLIPNSSYLLETIVVENPSHVVYNGQAWYCLATDLAGAVIRTRRQGDTISRAGGGGSKLLRRYLTDQKIPLPVRDLLLFVAKGKDVLWIPGIAHATGFTDEISQERYNLTREYEELNDLTEPSILVRVSLILDTTNGRKKVLGT